VPPEDSLEVLRAKGDDALAAGDFENAVQIYTRALRVNNSRDAHCLCSRSAAQLALGRAHEACLDARVVVRLKPQYAPGLLRKGLAHRALGQEAEADTALTEALRLDPQNKEVRQAMGLARQDPAAGKKPAPQALEPEADERAFRCADCGEAAEFGAIDETDGNWYCKSCWESFITEEPAKGAVPDDAQPEPPPEEPTSTEKKAPPPRRLWADEPVGDEVLFSPANSEKQGVELMAARGPAPDRDRWGKGGQRSDRPGAKGGQPGREQRDRRQGPERPAGNHSAGGREQRDRRPMETAGGKPGASGRDARDRRPAAERPARDGRGQRESHQPQAAEAKARTPIAATLAMPRNPFGAARS